MATYDNRHWLLSHVRNSFVSTDDSGLCELVMLAEDLPRLLRRRANRPPPPNPRSSPPSSPSPSPCPSESATCRAPVELLSPSPSPHLIPPPAPPAPPGLEGYPELERSDEDEPPDEDPLADSYDLQHDMDFGLHRQRSNTAQRLEKMEYAQKKAAKIKIIKWEGPNNNMTDQEREHLFTKKDILSRRLPADNGVKKKSLLTDQLEKCPLLPQNQYLEYAKFDGVAQFGMPTKTYKIFMTMLPEDHRNYPINICVVASAKIKDLIGFICYRYSILHPEIVLNPVWSYGLFICEDDGEVDSDLPCLDANEACSKYGFTCLGLVDIKAHQSEKNADIPTCSIPEKGGFNVIVTGEESKSNEQSVRSRSATFDSKDKSKNLDRNDNADAAKNSRFVNRANSSVSFRDNQDRAIGLIVNKFNNQGTSAPTTTVENKTRSRPVQSLFSQYLNGHPKKLDPLARIMFHQLSMEAPNYQSYHVEYVWYWMKAPVLLGISGDKIEIDPVLSTPHLLVPRVKPVSYSIDSIASCEIMNCDDERSIFRIKHSSAFGFNLSTSQEEGSKSSKSHSSFSSGRHKYKHFDIETDKQTAEEIVLKVDMILDLKSSACRKLYKSKRKFAPKLLLK